MVSGQGSGVSSQLNSRIPNSEFRIPSHRKIEVELKAWADDLPGLRKKVEKIARLKEEVIQEDIYFTFAHAQGYQKQRFRLRKCGMQSIVTVKVPVASPLVGDRYYESNQEFEFEVSDPEAFKIFCREFGFRVLMEKRKKVQKYQLKKSPRRGFPLPVTIELNQVEGLGNFIEIETLVERKNQISRASQFLKSLLKKLGVPLSQIEPTPYTEMLYSKRNC